MHIIKKIKYKLFPPKLLGKKITNNLLLYDYIVDSYKKVTKKNITDFQVILFTITFLLKDEIVEDISVEDFESGMFSFVSDVYGI